MWISGNIEFGPFRRIFTFGFIQRSFIEAVISLAIFAALGKFVAERYGQTCFLLIFFLAPVFGLAVYIALLQPSYWIIGLFPAVFGMVGGFTMFQIDLRRAEGDPILPAFSLIGFLMAIQLIFYFIFGGSMEWIGEFGAFLAGLGIAFFCGREGENRRNNLIRRIRNR